MEISDIHYVQLNRNLTYLKRINKMFVTIKTKTIKTNAVAINANLQRGVLTEEKKVI